MIVSFAMQEYLAEAYRIASYQDDDPYISTSALAGVMQVSAPAVTRMVQRLKALGYLEHEPYRGVKLTAEGERLALHSIRRHRLVERFMVDVMQFQWHEVHDAADDLSETVSDKIVDRIAEMAHHPQRCPHGEPIPSEDGVMPEVIDYPLTEMPADTTYIVSRVHTHDPDVLQYIGSLTLHPGQAFHFMHQAPFGGPLQIKVEEDIHFIGNELASILQVCSPAEFDLS